MNRPLLPLLALLVASSTLTASPALAWVSANRFGGGSFRGWGAAGHVNAWGGRTVHVDGYGTVHTNAYGGRTYLGYPAYHPPVAVPYYAGRGCYGCAAAAGAIVGGVAAGAAYAAGATSAYGAPPPSPVGYATLPAGSQEVTRLGTVYYVNGNTWYQPVYGANGVYYQVVPAP